MRSGVIQNFASAIIAKLTQTVEAVGFTIAGGTTSKTLTVDETVAMSSKAPKASPVFTGPVMMEGFIQDRFEKLATATLISLFSLAVTSLSTSCNGIIEISYSTLLTGVDFFAGYEAYSITMVDNVTLVVTNIHTVGSSKIPAPTVSGKTVTFKYTGDLTHQVRNIVAIRFMGTASNNGNLGEWIYTKL